jgi:hypothetical protein
MFVLTGAMHHLIEIKVNTGRPPSTWLPWQTTAKTRKSIINILPETEMNVATIALFFNL